MVQMVLCVILFFALSFPNGLNCVKNDLTFVIDTAAAGVTQEQFDDVIDFVINITNKLTIGINDTMVAVVTFNDNPTAQFDLDDYSDRTSLLSAINDLKEVQLTGVRNTHLALDQVRTNIYIPASGRRSDANSVVILITYGEAASPVQTMFSAFSLQGAVTTIYSIGVGNFVLDSTKTEDLRNVATGPASDHVFYVESILFLCNNLYNISSSLDPNVSSVDNCPAIPTTTVLTTSKITTIYLASSTSATTTHTTPTAKGSTSDPTTHTTSTEGSNTATANQTTSTRSTNDTTTEITLTEESNSTTPTQTTSTGESTTITTIQTTSTAEESTTDTTNQAISTEKSNTTTTTQTTSAARSTTATANQTTSTGELTTATTTRTTSTEGSTTATVTLTTSSEGSTTAKTTHTASVEVTTIATSTLSQSGSSQVTVISVSLVLVLLILTAILIAIFYLPKYRKRKRYLDVIFILVNEYPDIDNGLGPSKPRYQEVKHVYKNGHSSKFHSYLKLSIMNNGCKPVSR